MSGVPSIESCFESVKSGSDFSSFISILLGNGVACYFHYVSTGNIIFVKHSGETVMLKNERKLLSVQNEFDSDKVKFIVKQHFRGQVSYADYCKQLADAGVAKWVVDLSEMARCYYSKRNEVIYSEAIILA